MAVMVSVVLRESCVNIFSQGRGYMFWCSRDEVGKLYVVAVTPWTLLKTVAPGMLMKLEQKVLAEALFARRARRTLSALQTPRWAMAASTFLPRIWGTSLARTQVYRDAMRERMKLSILSCTCSVA